MSKQFCAAADPRAEEDARLAREGDRDAMGRLFEAYHDQTIKYLATLTSDQSLVEDVCAETWMKVLDKIGTYQTAGAGFPAWVCRIAKHQLMDHYRSGRVRREHLAPSLLSAETWVDPGSAPDAHAIATEARVAIAGAIEDLNTTQRRAVILHYFVGLTLAQTAEQMGKSQGTVTMAIQRAKKRLAPILTSYAPGNFDVSTLVALMGSERATELM